MESAGTTGTFQNASPSAVAGIYATASVAAAPTSGPPTMSPQPVASSSAAATASVAVSDTHGRKASNVMTPLPCDRPDTYSFAVSGTTFQIDNRYKFIKPIGHGAYGVVM